MTIEEFYKDNNVLVSMHIDVVDTPSHTMAMMREYAKLKCQELLEIVSEKAEITKSVNFGWEKVDKESILSAVDLNKFIV